MISAVRRTALPMLALALSAAAFVAPGPAVADEGPDFDPRPYTDARAWLSANLPMDQLVDGDVGLTWRAAQLFPDSPLANLARAHFDEWVGEPAAARTQRIARAIEIGSQMQRDVGPLVNELTSRMLASGPAAGRFADRAPGAAYVDTADQGYATYVLSLHDASAADQARSFLLRQQCADGGFRPQPADVSAVDQRCHGDTSRTRDSVLATAEALGGLQRGIFESLDVSDAFQAAGAWLTRPEEQRVGPFTDADEDSALLAEIEPRLALYGTEGMWPAGWLRGLQAHDAGACVTGLHSERGAVAPDPAALASAERTGIPPGDRAAWVRSTVRSMAALGDAPDVYTSPRGKDVALRLPYGAPSRVHAGSIVTLQAASNLGDSTCLTGPGTRIFRTLPSSLDAQVRAPTRTGRATYVLTNSAGESEAVTLDVLGAQRLGLRLGRHRVHRHHNVRIVVSGLAPHESLSLHYRGKVRHATADASGHYRTRLAVGKKRGRHTLTVVGQYADRRGHATIRVTR